VTDYILAAVWGVCWFATARALYFHWKWWDGHGWRKCPRDHGEEGWHQGCCLDEVRGMPDGGVAFCAMAAALAFPLVWATALVRWQPTRLRLMRSARGGVRVVRRTQVLAGKALEVAEREALRDE
jgi:hypothetical protein